jgi:hypothetical protein
MTDYYPEQFWAHLPPEKAALLRVLTNQATSKLFNEHPYGYGLWDTEEEVWLGDLKGPNIYQNEEMARAAATVLGKMLEYPFGRLRAYPFIDDEMVPSGVVEAVHSGEEAIDLLEGGPNGPRSR